MPFQDLLNGGIGVFFMVKEAIDGSRRHREMASAARELAGKVPSTLAIAEPPEYDEYKRDPDYTQPDATPSTHEGIKQRLQAAKGGSHLSTEDTIRYQNREIGKQLVALEHHLAQRMRIQGVPCDCGSSKHLLFLEQLCQETISMSVNPSTYEAIMSWVRESEPKCTEEGAKSGRYDEEYPVMASQVRDFRKRVLGTKDYLAMVEPGQEMSLGEAKGETRSDNPGQYWLAVDRAGTPALPKSIHTLTLPPETKAAMLSLCEKARGKKVEYGMVMLIRDSEIRAGSTKWGAREKMRIEVTEPLGGIFHIHPDTMRAGFSWEELHGKKIAKSVRWETVEREPQLSDVDNLRLLVDDKLLFVGVGTPHRNYIKVMTKIKEVEPQLKGKLIEIFPLVAGFGTPVEGIEEYYQEYTIRLDDGAPSYIDVWI